MTVRRIQSNPFEECEMYVTDPCCSMPPVLTGCESFKVSDVQRYRHEKEVRAGDDINLLDFVEWLKS